MIPKEKVSSLASSAANTLTTTNANPNATAIANFKQGMDLSLARLKANQIITLLNPKNKEDGKNKAKVEFNQLSGEDRKKCLEIIVKEMPRDYAKDGFEKFCSAQMFMIAAHVDPDGKFSQLLAGFDTFKVAFFNREPVSLLDKIMQLSDALFAFQHSNNMNVVSIFNKKRPKRGHSTDYYTYVDPHHKFPLTPAAQETLESRGTREWYIRKHFECIDELPSLREANTVAAVDLFSRSFSRFFPSIFEQLEVHMGFVQATDRPVWGEPTLLSVPYSQIEEMNGVFYGILFVMAHKLYDLQHPKPSVVNQVAALSTSSSTHPGSAADSLARAQSSLTAIAAATASNNAAAANNPAATPNTMLISKQAPNPTTSTAVTSGTSIAATTSATKPSTAVTTTANLKNSE